MHAVVGQTRDWFLFLSVMVSVINRNLTISPVAASHENNRTPAASAAVAYASSYVQLQEEIIRKRLKIRRSVYRRLCGYN